MRIAAVEAVAVSVPLREPLRMAVATVTARDCVVVRVRSDSGLEGVGDAVIAPYFTGETLGSALALVRGIAAGLLAGADVFDTERIDATLSKAIVGNPATRSALEIALWDLKARALGVPLYQLLGGRMRAEVPTIWHLSHDGADPNAKEAAQARAEGFRWFKLKVGKGAFADEVASTHAVRDAIGPDADLVLDANQAWTPPEAVRFLDAVADAHVRFVEQPVHRADMRGLAWVQARTAVAVVADEAVFDPPDLLEHAACGAVQGVVTKLIKAGGVAGVMRVATVADAAGIGVHLAGMAGETSISAAAGTHVAVALRSLTFGTGIAPHYLVDDVVEEWLRPQGGVLSPPPGPGLGVTVSEEALRRLAIDP